MGEVYVLQPDARRNREATEIPILPEIPETEQNIAAMLVLFNSAITQLYPSELISVDVAKAEALIHDFVNLVLGPFV